MEQPSNYNTYVMIALGIFFGLSLLVGILPSRKASKGFLSFMIADKSLPWWAIAGTVFATYAGTTTLLGWVGNSARIGLTALWQCGLHAASFLLLSLFFVPILVRMKRVTLAEPLGERYGNNVRQITAALSFFRMVGSVASQIVGIGVVIAIFTDLNLQMAMIVSAVVLIVYVSVGGMYGVAYADTFQGLIMILFLVIAPIYLLVKIGDGSLMEGFGKVLANVPREHLTVTNESPNRIVGWILVMSVANLLRPELFGRIFSARNPKEGVLTWVVVTNIVVLIMIAVVTLGLIAKFMVPDFKGSGDQYGPALFMQAAPLWLTIFYILGVMGAAVSTASSSMLGSASHYITDFHLPIFYKNGQPSQKKMLLLSRLSVIFFTCISLWWALAWKDIINIFQFGYTVLVGGVLVPYLGMFFWPRMTSAAAKWSAILGGGTTIIWKFVLQDFSLIPVGWIARLDPSVPALLLSIGTAIIFTYSNKPEYAKVHEFAKAYDLKRMLRWAEEGMAKEKQ